MNPTIRDIVLSMVNQTIVVMLDPQGIERTGIPTMVEMEDGSGKNWNVRLRCLDKRIRTLFIRTK